MTAVSLRVASPDPATPREPSVARRRAKRLDRLVVSALVAVVAAATGAGVDLWPAINGDEGIYTNQMWSVLHGSIEAYTYSYDHPFFGWSMIAPFSWMAERLGASGTGMAVLDVRVLMVGLAALDAALLYHVAKRLGSSRFFAASAVVLWGLSPLAVTLSREVYLDNIALPWFLASLLLALDPLRRQWHYMAAGVCFALSVLSKETFLLMAPALVWIIAQRTRGQLRSIALTSTLACVCAVGALYPLFALLRGELLPGQGHVSLWEGQIWSQLVARAGSGALWDKTSQRYALVTAWLHMDTWLPAAGVASTALAVPIRRLRPVIAAVALNLAILLKPSGYLPGMFPIGVLPLLALLLAGVLDAAHRHLRVIPVLPKRAGRILAAGLVVAFAVVTVRSYVPNDLRFSTTDDVVAPYVAADRWVTTHLPRSANVLTDPVFYVDLIHHGFAHQWRGAIVYYQYDLDPESFKKLPGGWRDLQYVIVTPAMRDQISGKALALPRTAAAIAHGYPIASFGRGSNKIVVEKIGTRRSFVYRHVADFPLALEDLRAGATLWHLPTHGTRFQAYVPGTILPRTREGLYLRKAAAR